MMNTMNLENPKKDEYTVIL